MDLLMMRVTINGVDESLDEGLTMSDLLARLELQPIRVAVELNRDLLPRRDYAQTSLRDGDRVEIVTFVGGG
jgi:thiamine biosynthesis protein ThiS